MALKHTDYHFDKQQKVYKGKVRDVYIVDKHFIAIASDRISAFDHILPEPIPYKGQVLNQIASYFLKETEDIVPNWLRSNPDPNVSIGIECEPIRIEMVIRGYLVGHAWREYKAGKRMLCGIPLKEGMRQNEKFIKPIITPATKADSGHDEDISKEEIIERQIIDLNTYEKLETYTRQLFERGQMMANKRGLILVDTKYEFGLYEGQIYLIDEIHTPDSSRYFYLDSYNLNFVKNESPEQLSKEFVREWLMDNSFQGLEGQKMPVMPIEFINKVSDRYISLYEILTGRKFEKATGNIEKRIYNNIINFLKNKVQ